MVNVVGYSQDIIPYAQTTLNNPSDDGVNFVMSDKNDSSWTMEAVRGFDGSIKGFKVGEECPYADEWNFALLDKNSYDEYAILQSWPSAVENFTFVWEFNEFGVGWAQEGRNYYDDILSNMMWEAYFYKPGTGSDFYAYWYTFDMVRYEYFDTNMTYCIAFRNDTTMNITNPFGSCP